MNLKEEREKAGLSRQEVCDRMGIPYRTLQNWEMDNNETHLPPEYVQRWYLRELKELSHR